WRAPFGRARIPAAFKSNSRAINSFRRADLDEQISRVRSRKARSSSQLASLFFTLRLFGPPAFAGPGGSGAAPGEPALGAAACLVSADIPPPALAPPEPPPAQWQKDARD